MARLALRGALEEALDLKAARRALYNTNRHVIDPLIEMFDQKSRSESWDEVLPRITGESCHDVLEAAIGPHKENYWKTADIFDELACNDRFARNVVNLVRPLLCIARKFDKSIRKYQYDEFCLSVDVWASVPATDSVRSAADAYAKAVANRTFHKPNKEALEILGRALIPAFVEAIAI